jgi:hypothetical protein
MNGKKLACVLLLMIVGALAYFGQVGHKKADAKRAEAETAKSEKLKAEDALRLSEIKLTTLKADTEELRRFLQSWTPYAERIQTQSEVEQTVLASLRNANLLVLKQAFESKKSPGQLYMPSAVRASIVLEDDYAKTVNWIGEMERKLPLARMTSCRLTGGDNGRQVHAEVILEVPLADLKVSPAALAAKDVKKR